MDFADLKPIEESRPLKVLHPITGEELTNDKGDVSTIYLIGRDTKQFRSITSELESRNKGKKISRRKAEELNIELLSRCTTGWENIQFEGKNLKHSFENASKKLYTLAWLREQVDDFIYDRSQHLGNSKSD